MIASDQSRDIRIRIVSDGTRLGTDVTDAATGKPIHGVMRVAFDLSGDALGAEEAHAVVEVLAELDVTLDGEVRRYRLHQDTGEMELIGDPGLRT